MMSVGRWFLAMLSAAAVGIPGTVMAQHACDDLGDAGWGTVATVETVAQSDGKPYRAAAGNWYVDRKTTLLPFCNYYNSIGNYSLRSYTLSPEVVTERVEICRAPSSGATPVAVGSYTGSCPPG